MPVSLFRLATLALVFPCEFCEIYQKTAITQLEIKVYLVLIVFLKDSILKKIDKSIFNAKAKNWQI